MNQSLNLVNDKVAFVEKLSRLALIVDQWQILPVSLAIECKIDIPVKDSENDDR